MATELAEGQKVGGGRYTLVRFLGKGGMGMVWLARDEHLEDDVALKFLTPEIAHDADALDDMRRETLKSRKLSHPNIIRIHDFHQAADEAPFISMEYIEGAPLSSMKSQQPERLFPWEQLKPLIQQLCSALDYAHGQKVVHRDLKPGNLMVTKDGVLKLADFGIAATASDSLSRLTRQMGSSGTPAYMSPQQMSSSAPKPSDDIYALGAMLYELLTSRPPFYTGDIFRQVMEIPPVPMEERLRDFELQNPIPPDVSAVVMACLGKQPEQRPQSAAAVAEWIGLESSTGGTVRLTGARLVAAAPREEEESADSNSASGEAEQPVAAGKGNLGLWVGVAVGVVALLVGAVFFFSGRNGRPPASGKSADTAAPAAVAPAVETAKPSASVASPVTTTVAPAPQAEFQSLFNGRDLTGWSGDPKLWSAKDGMIIGDTTGHTPINGNQFLTYKTATFSDFELRFKARMVSGNSGVQYRSTEQPGWKVKGYQMEVIDPGPAAPVFGGMTFEGTRPSGQALARLGEKVVIGTDGKAKPTGTVGPGANAIMTSFKAGDWNDYTVIAQGRHVIQKMNGAVSVELTDNDIPNAPTSGVIALQLHRFNGEPMIVHFKDIQIRPLAADVTAEAVGSTRWIQPFADGTLGSWIAKPSGQWTASKEGVVTGIGPKASLTSPGSFTNLEFKAEILNAPGGNGGLFFRIAGTKASGLFDTYEAQVSEVQQGKRTGSLYNIADTDQVFARDGEWFSMHAIAIGNRIQILVNGKVATDFTDPQSRYVSGPLGLQANTQGKSVSYRNVMYKALPADPAAALAEARKDVPTLK